MNDDIRNTDSEMINDEELKGVSGGSAPIPDPRYLHPIIGLRPCDEPRPGQRCPYSESCPYQGIGSAMTPSGLSSYCDENGDSHTVRTGGESISFTTCEYHA